ncbi:MAG: sulfite exporter TauE/SafE family protein [Roseobacter sp.]
MTAQDILLVLAGAAAGGFINGLAGFGTALFALSFFLAVMPPLEAVAVTVVLSVISGLQGVWIVRDAMFQNSARLARFVLPGVIGVPIGVNLLRLIDADTLKLVIALFLLLYGGYFSLRKSLPKIARHRPLTDCAVGFSGGVLGGAASLSGALPTMWCALRSWPKAEVRAVLQPYNVTILGLTTAMLAFAGAYHQQTLIYLAVALPATMVSAQIGIWLFQRITDAVFTRLLITLTFVSGAVLMLRVLL